MTPSQAGNGGLVPSNNAGAFEIAMIAKSTCHMRTEVGVSLNIVDSDIGGDREVLIHTHLSLGSQGLPSLPSKQIGVHLTIRIVMSGEAGVDSGSYVTL